MTAPPIALILAGPNGAGKTTVASVFVGPDVEFVNADIIGAELRRDDPHRPGADVTAGRIVSARLRALTAERKSCCFETNLAFAWARWTDRRMAFRWVRSAARLRVAPERRARTRPSRRPGCRRWPRRTGRNCSSPLHFRAALLLSRSTASESTNGQSTTTRPAVPC